MSKAYEIITDRIIELLQQGTVPWHKPWGGEQYHPRNLTSERPYRGINAWLLSAAGYESPYWLTYKQARDRGGHVKKGEKGWPCVYWNVREMENKKTGELENFPFLKYYTVFNVHQCDDVPFPQLDQPNNEFNPIEECERVVAGMPRAPPIYHDGTRAYYSAATDVVRMPPESRFDRSEDYYSTLFHELTHSTGHDSRLARPGIVNPTGFGSPAYSKEELIAEMGAAYLCGHTGIEQKVLDNSASYIDSWLNRLHEDEKLVVHSAGAAQKAADYILGCNGMEKYDSQDSNDYRQ